MDNVGNIITWHASSGKVLETFKYPVWRTSNLVKLNEAEVALAIPNGKRKIMLKHSKGRHIKPVRELSLCDIDVISRIDAYGQTVVAVGEYGTTELWDCVAGKLKASYEIAARSNFVKTCDNCILLGQSEDGTIIIHENGFVYGQLGPLDLKQYFRQHGRTPNGAHIHEITIINSNLMMMVCWLGIVFVSLPFGKILACSEFGSKKFTTCATILSDARIFSAGINRRCS